METYQEFKARHEKEVNALPLGFAFSEEQFEEMKLKLGVKENSELYRLGNTGGFYRKVDSELIHNTFKRHEEERRNAISPNPESMPSMFRACFIMKCAIMNLASTGMERQMSYPLATSPKSNWIPSLN